MTRFPLCFYLVIQSTFPWSGFEAIYDAQFVFYGMKKIDATY